MRCSQTPLLLVSASPFHQRQMTYYPGDMSMGITVTMNVAYTGPMPPINFVSAVSGKDIQLTWAMGANTTQIVIIRQANAQPLDRTDGAQVYSGSGLSYTDTGMANESVEYYYSAWGTDGSHYSTNASTTSAGGWGMTLLAYFVGIAILSFISIKSEFVLLKIAGMGGWFFMFMYIKSNPPPPLVEGSPAQQVLMMVCIAAGIGIALTSFGRSTVFSRNTGGSGVAAPKWKWNFGKDKDEFEGRTVPHNETVEEYQQRVRRALRRDK
jgi:hypothetical protein